MSERRGACRIVQEGSLYVLLFLLPFSKAAIEVMFGVLLLGWMLERLDPATRWDTVWRQRTLRPLAWALLGYLAVCTLSIAVSDYRVQSIRGVIEKWLEYLLFFVMVADVGFRPGVARRCATVVAWSSLFVVIEAVSQELLGRGIFRHYTLVMYTRMTGPYENPIDLATYLMVVIPLLLVDAASRRGAARLLLGGLLLALSACLARTVAAGPWAGFAIALLVLVVVRPRLWPWVAAIAVLGAAAGLAVFHYSTVFHPSQIFSLSDVGTNDRRVMWQAALGMIRDRPLLGHGVNTFMANYLAYWVGGERMPRYAHNCYLQVAAETGLIGLATFLALLGLSFKQMMRGVRVRTDEGLLLCGLLAGLAAFALHAGVDTNFYALRQAALFWVLAGLAVGLSLRLGPPALRER